MLKMLAWCLLACGHHPSSVKSLKDASSFVDLCHQYLDTFSFFALIRAMLFITGRHSFPFMDIIQEWMLLDCYRIIICSFTYPEEYYHTTQLHKHIYLCVCIWLCVYTGSHEHVCLCVSLSMYRLVYVQFSSVHSLSSVRLFAAPWTATYQASLSIINSLSLLKFMSIESVMLSNHIILSHPLLLLPSIFPIIRVFSNELAPCIRWPKYCGFSLNISPSSEYSGLISLGSTGWISLQSKWSNRRLQEWT